MEFVHPPPSVERSGLREGGYHAIEELMCLSYS
jgi:hypothetical protein